MLNRDAYESVGMETVISARDMHALKVEAEALGPWENIELSKAHLPDIVFFFFFFSFLLVLPFRLIFLSDDKGKKLKSDKEREREQKREEREKVGIS
jgi:hypothetical protein